MECELRINGYFATSHYCTKQYIYSQLLTDSQSVVMSAITDPLTEEFSRIREEIRDKFQTLRIQLNQREQELERRVAEMETSLRAQSEGLLSDLAKLKRTQSVLEDTLDSRELAGTQEATLSLIREKVSLLETSYADIRAVATLLVDIAPLQALVSGLGELSPTGERERDPSPSPSPSPLRFRRSHTPDPYSNPSDAFDLSHRPTRYSVHIDSFHSRSDTPSDTLPRSRSKPDRPASLYMRSDSFLSRTAERVPRTISESYTPPQWYMTPQPVKKSSGFIGKIGKYKK